MFGKFIGNFKNLRKAKSDPSDIWNLFYVWPTILEPSQNIDTPQYASKIIAENP